MRHGFAGCYQAVMVALILFVGLAAAAAAVDVFFVAPEDPDDGETRAGTRFIPLESGGLLIADATGDVDTWSWSTEDGEFIPEEPDEAAAWFIGQAPQTGAEVAVSGSGPDGWDTQETTDIVVYAADLDADAVTDPDPDPSDDPEEDPGLFIGAGDERQKITLATVPGGILPTGGDPDLDRWEVDLSVDGLGEAVSLWEAAGDGEELNQTSWSAHWDGQQWVCNSGPMPSELWIQGDGPGTGSIGLDVYIRDACDSPPQQGAYDYIEYRVIAVDMDAEGVPIDEEEEAPGALVAVDGTAELYINGPSYCSDPDAATLTLSWTNDAKVDVWHDPEKTQAVQNGAGFSVGELMGMGDFWGTLHVEGEQVSGSPRDVAFTLDYNGDGIHTKDIVNFTVVRLNAQATGVADADEEDPGAFVGWNTDDDNNNGEPDIADDEGVAGGDDDLLAVTINAPEPGFLDPENDEVTLNWFGSGIGVYADEEKADPLTQGEEFGQADLPATVYVEGASPTDAQGVLLKTTYSRGGITAEDEIAFTVVAADLLAWQLAGASEPDPAELDPGLFVCVNVDDAPQNLQTLTLDVLSDDELADQVRIAWTNDVKVDVFSDPQGTMPVASAEERTFDLADLPLQLYVEGVEHSDALRDVEFTLDYLHDGTVLHTDLIKTTVVKIDLSGHSLELEGPVPEEEEEDPGAFVHFNVDNDNDNTDAEEDPIADGTESQDPVTDENDLCAAAVTISPAGLDVGTVVLKRMLQSNGTLQVWSHAEKGSANAVVTGNDSHSWDLSDPDDASHFAAVHDDLHVEGIDWPAESGTGSGTLVAELRDPSGGLLCSDNVAYTLMAALCQGQPKPDERDMTGGMFPSLVHCEWSTNGEWDSRYDCVAWSVGLTDRYFTDEQIDEYGNKNGVVDEEDWDDFYAYYGYERVGSIDEADIVVYKNPARADPSNPEGYSHAVRVWEPEPPCQCGALHWKMFGSKLDMYELIEHRRDQLNDGYYGCPELYYRKSQG